MATAATSVPELGDAVLGALSAGLDFLPIACFALDARGYILVRNRAACRLLQRSGLITAAGDVLGVASPRYNRVLRELVYRMATNGRRPAGFCMVRQGGKPLSVMVAPWQGGRLSGSPVAMVFVGEPEMPLQSDPSLLADLFGFTTAESRLASLLTRGASIDEAATVLDLSKHTVKNQQRHLFAKTRTNTHTDLVRVLLGSPAHLDLFG
jgi:DNA-binding CsgD family transcriptional regulator